MKRDKARAITQERVQDGIVFALDDMMWLGGFERTATPISHPRDRYDERKLHHYDPVPTHRAVAKKRRWRI